MQQVLFTATTNQTMYFPPQSLLFMSAIKPRTTQILYKQSPVHIRITLWSQHYFPLLVWAKNEEQNFCLWPEETKVRLFILAEELTTATIQHEGVIAFTENELKAQCLRSIAHRTTKSSAWPINRFGHGPVQLYAH